MDKREGKELLVKYTSGIAHYHIYTDGTYECSPDGTIFWDTPSEWKIGTNSGFYYRHNKQVEFIWASNDNGQELAKAIIEALIEGVLLA